MGPRLAGDPLMADALAPLAPGRLLTAAAYQHLADVPAEIEWFANLGSG